MNSNAFYLLAASLLDFNLTTTARRRDGFTTLASCSAEQNVVKPSRRRAVVVKNRFGEAEYYFLSLEAKGVENGTSIPSVEKEEHENQT